MAKGMTIKDAIKIFEEKSGVVATEVEKVMLNGMCPPIEKMDATLSTLKACKHLALSTNNIEKISSLSGMENLRILSLGRNMIKKIENLDAVADTLEELWISYNQIQNLVGVEKLLNLRVLFMSNNKIASWTEIDKLAVLDKLEDLLLIGNPLYNDYKDNNALSEYRVEVVKRLPNLRKLDGIPIDVDEREQAKAAGGA
mmetsp:Transcript_26052/g.56876  ORF Transcript_26052/g.56876 Transcript_26052/m.56876 type:complete len:199 (+) Transcript_26052:202-798(+)|eukprot:CAMPEP_0202906620 /NCGR_PEP_ID=MMETSP1392-20130828/39789_1 /ASSEMBLY_ACC=CAM_ASM_000868 /TAXON_ID=225041 /ORGANISM="Chlamydomonas chlamydogama, Strain SAG 11-48b" /LENGTH=198 /DNA_ID=CAMNT_0049595235 /DNA_START=184 /DNA_END=780 /DNA_ORIENTATION=+